MIVMKEKELLKNKLIKHLFFNLLAFAIILSIFGVFIFFTVKNIIYKSADEDLVETTQLLTNLQTNYDIFKLIPQQQQYLIPYINQTIEGLQDYMLEQRIKNPKITMILRDSNKNILNENALGRIGNYLNNIDFQESNLNKIYDLKINGEYNYRGVNLKLSSYDDEDRFIQLLINVDSENELMLSFKYVISSTVLLGILLSVIASYVLSNHTLKPLQNSIESQIEFVQNVSHELRTPLTIIQAKQELLLKEPNAKIMDKSEEIILTLNETKRLTKLTKDLTILTRADSQNLSIQKESVNIDEFIENIVKPYIEIAELEEKKFKLDLNCSTEINIDTNRIYQLIIILLDNAIKYTEEGDLIEIVSNIKDNKCILEIKDTGIGVTEEGLTKIFERFYREDKARSRESGGTGLGLSIASLIVSAHGGNIKATHNSPKGTVFTIKLPK